MMESGETIDIAPTIEETEVPIQEPIEDEIEETCCSWDYDLDSEGGEDWD
jgi:hypothetical protein